MAILAKLQELLDGRGIDYEVLNHPAAYTAQQVAEEEHIPGREFAKVVVVKGSDRFFIGILPAPDHVNLGRFSRLVGMPVRLATEGEFSGLFPGCEPGAMPPIGDLFGMEVFMEDTLTRRFYIAFNAGNHRQSIRLRTKDFMLIVHPRVAAFSNHIAVEAQVRPLCKSEGCV